jgi:O-succinylbenzoate synthase
MKLSGVELVRVRIPFRREIRTAVTTHAQRDLLFFRVVTEEAEGWGECAALAEGTSVDPSVDAVERLAVDRGIRRLIDAAAARGGAVPGRSDVAQLFGTSPADRLLAATFEMAVSDAELRRSGLSLGADLEVRAGFESVAVGSAIGIPVGRDIGELCALVEESVAAGSGRVRLKIEPGWDVDPVEAVRRAFPDLALHVDANGAYRLEDAEHLERLSAFDLICIEQPLPPADLIALAELAKRLTLPVGLDESLTSPRRVLDALRNGACEVACLKPGRLGGVRAARAAAATCAAADVPVFVGGFFEAGLGRASNLSLAARLHQDSAGLVGDLGDPNTYLAVDPCGYPNVQNGWVRLSDQPGVGEAPDAGTLAEFGAQRRWFPATYT